MQLQRNGPSESQGSNWGLIKIPDHKKLSPSYVILMDLETNLVFYTHTKIWTEMRKTKADRYKILTWTVNAAAASFIVKGIESDTLELTD